MTRLHVDLKEKADWSALSTPITPDLQKSMGRIHGTLKLPFKPGTLTIAMIVKNEVKNIREAIESFRPIADEIIVNDTGSTDGTQEVLETLGVKWFQGDWRSDFSYARNLAIDQATSSWVLWMDADDRIPADQIENFRKLKTAPLDRAFGFQVINTQGGMPVGGRFMQVRMFPNHPQLRFRYRIHEQVLHAIAGLGLHMFYTETTLWHTGYEEPEMKANKARRNLQLLAEEKERMVDEPALAMSVGDSHFILGDWEKGIEAYRKVWEIPNCQERHQEVYAEIPSCIGRGLQHLGKREDALGWFEKSMVLQPNKVEPFFYRAECLMEMGRKAEAELAFAHVTEMPLAYTATANQYDVVRMYSFYHLSRLLAERGEIDKAINNLNTMHCHYTQVVESWLLLGQLLGRLSRWIEALVAFEKSLSIFPSARPEAHEGRLRCLQELNRGDDFNQARDEAMRHFPQVTFPLFGGKRNPRLTLTLIVKNEAHNLPACLATAKHLVDEIVIVDTGSTDGTLDIIRNHGAILVQRPWDNDFSAARNAGLDRATGDWILWLDADDRVPSSEGDALRAWVNAQSLPAAKAAGLLVKNSGDGGLTGTVFNQIRIFPNRRDIRFESPIHEQVLPALERAQVSVEYLNLHVLHTGYADPVLARKKQERNRAMLEAQVNQRQNISAITLYTLGHACLDLGDIPAAEQHFNEARNLALAQGNNPHVVAQVPVKLAICQAMRNRFSEAWNSLQPALTGKTVLPEALLVKAQILHPLGREDEARQDYEKLLELEEHQTFMPVDFALLKVKACQYLASYWHARGQRDLAMQLLRDGIALSQGKAFNRNTLESHYRTFGVETEMLMKS